MTPPDLDIRPAELTDLLPVLRAIYERQGFVLAREGRMDGWPAAWYERRVE